MVSLPIRFTDHAVERGRDYHLDLDEATAIVRAPQQIVTVREFRQSLADDGRSLFRVLVELTSDEIVVVTMYKTNKVDKYWIR